MISRRMMSGFPAGSAPGFRPIGRFNHFEAFFFKIKAQDLSDLCLIISNQYGLLSFHSYNNLP